MRLLVYIELPYFRDEQGYSTDQPFMQLVFALRRHVERLTLVGRVEPRPRREAYAVPADIDVVPLPHYPSLKDVRGLVRATPAALARIRSAVARADAVWAIGPHPLSIPVALAGLAGRKRVVLGVRQHFPDYVRYRLPSGAWRPAVGAAWALEAAFRLLARRVPAVVVGPDLARRYASRRGRLLDLPVSLVSERALAEAPARASRDGTRVELLSVGRLDPEKAPELLLQMLALLDRDGGPRYRLTYAGSGELEPELRRAAAPFGDRVRFVGHVPHGPELFALYRGSDVFVHTARTEGIPSVLLEAQLFGLPVVGTDVGGVHAVVEGGAAGLLVPPGDPPALADAVRRLAADPALAERLAERGRKRMRGATLERAAADLHAFIAGTAPTRSARTPAAGGA